MKSTMIKLSAFTLALLAGSANATILKIDDPYYVGSSDATPANPATNKARITALIALAPGTTSGVNERSSNDFGSLPSPDALCDQGGGGGGGPNGTGNLAGPVCGTYLIGKNSTSGAQSFVWYLTNLPDNFIDNVEAVGRNGKSLNAWDQFTACVDCPPPPPPVDVPEPGTLALMGLGLLGLGLARRRRQA